MYQFSSLEKNVRYNLMSIMYFSSQVEQVKNTFKNLSKKVWKVGLEMSKSPWLTSKYHLTRANIRETK